MENQINRMAGRIDDLLAQAESGVRRGCGHLPAHLKAARSKLDELRQESGEAWGDLKPGLQKAWKELRDSVEIAASRFKKDT